MVTGKTARKKEGTFRFSIAKGRQVWYADENRKQGGNTMAFLQVEFFSKTLGVASTVNVILPEADMGIGVTAGGGEEKLPTAANRSGWVSPSFKAP